MTPCRCSMTETSFHPITLISSYSNYLVHRYQFSASTSWPLFLPKHYITKLWDQLFVCFVNQPLKLICKIRAAFVCVFSLISVEQFSKMAGFSSRERERARARERQADMNMMKLNNYIINLYCLHLCWTNIVLSHWSTFLLYTCLLALCGLVPLPIFT